MVYAFQATRAHIWQAIVNKVKSVDATYCRVFFSSNSSFTHASSGFVWSLIFPYACISMGLAVTPSAELFVESFG